MLFLAVQLAAVANETEQGVLQLSDGRVFQSWSVMREAKDSITIRYAKGMAKIMKKLLPAEVLAQHPLIESPAPVVASLPPEPQGLDKPTKGERSISARDTITDTDVKWICRIAVKGIAGGITRTSKNRAGEFKNDYVFPFGVDDVVPLEEAIAKARKWAAAVAEKKPPSFEKSLGQVLGHEWTFNWDGERVSVRTGMSEATRFEEQDLEKMQLLLAALPHMEKERLDEAKAGEDFAATLK